MQPHLTHSDGLSQNSGADRQCGRCSAVVDEAAGAWLWDGKFYCRRCLDDAHPDLADYARAHSAIVETMPYSAREVGKAHTRVGYSAIATMSAVVAVIWILDGAGAPALAVVVAIALMHLLGLPVLAIKVWGIRKSFERCRPTVSVRDGLFQVRTAGRVVGTPLTECAWFIGMPSKANVFGRDVGNPFILPKQSVVLIALPPEPTTLPRLRKPHWGIPRFAAVGFTEQTRRGWEAFLTLAGVPRSTEKEYRSRPVKSKQ